jgi:hypothetical protein
LKNFENHIRPLQRTGAMRRHYHGHEHQKKISANVHTEKPRGFQLPVNTVTIATSCRKPEFTDIAIYGDFPSKPAVLQ